MTGRTIGVIGRTVGVTIGVTGRTIGMTIGVTGRTVGVIGRTTVRTGVTIIAKTGKTLPITITGITVAGTTAAGMATGAPDLVGIICGITIPSQQHSE
mgnify:CR=1 FL=1